MHNSILWIPIWCCWFTGQAQSFKNRAAIDTVRETGFYAIYMSAELSRYVKTDFSDLRIINGKGEAVPYIIRSNFPKVSPSYYHSFKIISNEMLDSGRNVLLIENSTGEKIDEFSLGIKNASVSRTMDISGSDDKQRWFSIIDAGNLERRFITNDDHYIENISIPLSAYHYFRLTVYNGKNDPLKILSVGRYSAAEFKAEEPFDSNPSCRFVQKDSNNHNTYITVYNQQRFHISCISLRVKGPKYFKRQVDINGKNEFLGSFSISSDSVFRFYLSAFRDSVWQIRINNGDNPPLEIKSVSTAQEAKKVIAYLESGSHYSLELNNDQAEIPHYDLQGFRDSIPSYVPDLSIGDIEPIVQRSIAPAERSFFKQVWVWPVIIAVLLLLALFTFRLSKEVANKD